eukprot:jgi/Tetstr1/453569/TSEL_040537.t1
MCRRSGSQHWLWLWLWLWLQGALSHPAAGVAIWSLAADGAGALLFGNPFGAARLGRRRLQQMRTGESEGQPTYPADDVWKEDPVPCVDGILTQGNGNGNRCILRSCDTSMDPLYFRVTLSDRTKTLTTIKVHIGGGQSTSYSPSLEVYAGTSDAGHTENSLCATLPESISEFETHVFTVDGSSGSTAFNAACVGLQASYVYFVPTAFASPCGGGVGIYLREVQRPDEGAPLGRVVCYLVHYVSVRHTFCASFRNQNCDLEAVAEDFKRRGSGRTKECVDMDLAVESTLTGEVVMDGIDEQEALLIAAVYAEAVGADAYTVEVADIQLQAVGTLTVDISEEEVYAFRSRILAAFASWTGVNLKDVIITDVSRLRFTGRRLLSEMEVAYSVALREAGDIVVLQASFNDQAALHQAMEDQSIPASRVVAKPAEIQAAIQLNVKARQPQTAPADLAAVQVTPPPRPAQSSVMQAPPSAAGDAVVHENYYGQQGGADGGQGLPMGAIAGTFIGCVALLLALLAGVLYFRSTCVRPAKPDGGMPTLLASEDPLADDEVHFDEVQVIRNIARHH